MSVALRSASNGSPEKPSAFRTSVGYVRVSIAMQSDEGVSLDAQEAAIKRYCELNDLHLFKIYRDIESGGKAARVGLQEN